jgi:dihydroorotate dehydrogenase
VGAAAVQVGTASFTDPQASERLGSDLREALFDCNQLTINGLRGRFLTEIG